MATEYISFKLHKIKFWRWALAAVFIVVSIISEMIYIGKGTLNEYLIILLNDNLVLLFVIFFVLLILAADVYDGIGDTSDSRTYSKINNTSKCLCLSLLYIFVLSAIIVGFLIAVCLIVGYFDPLRVSETYGANQNILSYTNGLNAVQSTVVSLILIWARLVFMIFLIYTINLKCRRNLLGFLGVLTITLFDQFFYETFNILQPIGILPIENTRILYTEGAAPALIDATRHPLYLSLIYWLFLILILFSISWCMLKNKLKQKWSLQDET